MTTAILIRSVNQGDLLGIEGAIGMARLILRPSFIIVAASRDGSGEISIHMHHMGKPVDQPIGIHRSKGFGMLDIGLLTSSISKQFCF